VREPRLANAKAGHSDAKILKQPDAQLGGENRKLSASQYLYRVDVNASMEAHVGLMGALNVPPARTTRRRRFSTSAAGRRTRCGSTTATAETSTRSSTSRKRGPMSLDHIYYVAAGMRNDQARKYFFEDAEGAR
jgi:hypothetical protein